MLCHLQNLARSMDAAKTKRLEEYATILEKQAQSAESQGNGNEAAKIYVKLIDIFLLLAREASDHPTWAKYATKAETLQKKTKEVIANSNGENAQIGKAGAIKKIFGLKSGEEKPDPNEKQDKPREQIPVQTKALAQVAAPHAEISQSQEQMIPKRLYDQLLEKSKQLESHIASMVERSDYENMQVQYRELCERLALLPSKTDYDDLTQRLTNSVPRAQYEELQRAFVNLVPKDTYNTAQARISELESQLENSIPKSVLDNLANEISLLIVTAAIPMMPLPETESTPSSLILGGRDHPVLTLITKPDEIQGELILMRQRIELLEMKIKAPSVESLKA